MRSLSHMMSGGKDGSKFRAITAACALAVLSCNSAPALDAQPHMPAATSASAVANSFPTEQEIAAAQGQVKQNPSDAKARLALADLLRRAKRDREAAQQYLEVTNLDPTNYVAFHQLATIKADPSQVEEAISYLSSLQKEKPKELMLRVALSELLERSGNYYQAARVLVDLVYQNAVPDKYQRKVNLRIHYLLAKAKEAQVKEGNAVSSAEDEPDTLPVPLPESTLHRDLTASKIKEPKAMGSVGHAPLLP